MGRNNITIILTSQFFQKLKTFHFIISLIIRVFIFFISIFLSFILLIKVKENSVKKKDLYISIYKNIDLYLIYLYIEIYSFLKVLKIIYLFLEVRSLSFLIIVKDKIPKEILNEQFFFFDLFSFVNSNFSFYFQNFILN